MALIEKFSEAAAPLETLSTNDKQARRRRRRRIEGLRTARKAFAGDILGKQVPAGTRNYNAG
jgi:hypothetical protein